MEAINGFVLLLLTGALVIGLALGFTIAWEWGYQAGQDSVTGEDTQAIYSTEETQ
jgi:hypothetical protein